MDGLAGATGLSYDAAGNLTSANGMTLTWDAQGHLASVSGAPGGNVSFSYDYAGRRVSKTVNGVTTYYLYSGDALVCELDASGSVLRSYNWGACGLVSDHSASGSRYYLFDGHGNTRALLDASGAVLSLGAYTAWGTPLSGMAPATALGWNGRTGAYLDSETGLLLMGARYYAPCIGRFISRDPSGFTCGPNLYAYCLDDPVDFFDPDGCGPSPQELFDAVFRRSMAGKLYAQWRWAWNNPGAAAKMFATNTLIPGMPVVRVFQSVVSADAKLGTMWGLMDGHKASAWEVADAGLDCAEANGNAAMLMYGAAEAAGAGATADAMVAGSPNCFPAGTKVQVVERAKLPAKSSRGRLARRSKSNARRGASVLRVVERPIERVKPGDLVVSRNPRTGRTEYKRVLRRTQNRVSTVVTLSLADSKSGIMVQKVTATPEHPLFVAGRGWVGAESVGVGSQIVTRAGPALVVKSIRRENKPGGYAVYNLTVEDDHTYFVGQANGGVWVHNVSPQPPLQFLHSEDLLTSTSSYRFWLGKSTPEILESLKQDSEFGELTVDPNGVIRDGNTRVLILKQRGYDINSLPRVIYRSGGLPGAPPF